MRIRTISLIIDVSAKIPVPDGRSRLRCVQDACRPLCERMECDDRVLFYAKDGIHVCNTPGLAHAAVNNYVPHTFKFDIAVNDCIEAAFSVAEDDDIYIIGITDKYKPWMDSRISDPHKLNVNLCKFDIKLWAYGEKSEMFQRAEEVFTFGETIDAIFQNDERHDNVCGPLFL